MGRTDISMNLYHSEKKRVKLFIWRNVKSNISHLDLLYNDYII